MGIEEGIGNRSLRFVTFSVVFWVGGEGAGWGAAAAGGVALVYTSHHCGGRGGGGIEGYSLSPSEVMISE